MSWKNLNLVQRFSILSAIFICSTAVAIGYLITRSYEKLMINNETSTTATFVRQIIDEYFVLEELTPSEFEGDVYKISYISRLLLSLPEVIRVKVYNRDRVIIWSDQASLINKRFPDNYSLDQAFSGLVQAGVKKPTKADNVFEKQYENVFEIYVPVFGKENSPVAVVELYKIPVSTWSDIQKITIVVLLVVAIGGGLLYLGLFGIVRKTYHRQLALEEEIKRSERLITTSFNVMSDVIIIISLDTRVIRANDAALKMFGPDIIGAPCSIAIKDSHHLSMDAPVIETLKTKKASSREIYSSKAGRYWDARSYPVERSDGELQCVVEVIRDITEQKELEQALRTSEESFQAIVEKSDEGILIANKDGIVDYVSPMVETFLDRGVEQLSGVIFEYPVSEGTVTEIDIVRENGEKSVAEMRVVETIWKGEAAYLVTLRDVTENVELRERLRTLSVTDELTGLNNRRGFLQLAKQHLNVAKRTKSKILMIFIDLDELKKINDNFGHSQGDLALKDTAGILKKTFRESDIIARIGGDEFAVLATEATETDNEFLIERLKMNIERHNKKGGRSYNISLSMGLVPYDPDSSLSIEEMLLRADELMYENKQENRNS